METAVTAISRATPICVRTMPNERRADGSRPGTCEICVVEELPSPDQTQPSHPGENNQAKPVTVQNLLRQCARRTFWTENEDRKD